MMAGVDCMTIYYGCEDIMMMGVCDDWVVNF